MEKTSSRRSPSRLATFVVFLLLAVELKPEPSVSGRVVKKLDGIDYDSFVPEMPRQQEMDAWLASSLLFCEMRQKLSIHPSILYRLSGVGSRGQQPKERSPDFPLPSYFFQLIRRDPQAFPDQSRDSLSNVSWVFPEVSYRRDMP
ncbi:hypothetical protein D4764_04G0008370 [Takifugu flavidus]|uniref:Neuromedin-S n=1 Tax=Takifugu flavidus TaxID=433684 RepID=A0A5C6N8P7_9TELE|nr:hypothetical protein D4764_04G0008370 [Takifugu flavidus]